MTPFELLASLLPISHGRFSLEIEPAEAFALRYRGMAQMGSWWSPGPSVEVDRVMTLELPETLDEPLALALHAWAKVLREAFEELETRESPTLAAADVLDQKFLRGLLTKKGLVGEEDFRERWRRKFAAALPLAPELVEAEKAVIAFYKESSIIAQGGTEKVLASLEYVQTEPREGAIALVVRLLVYDHNEQHELIIRDIKEQQVLFMTAGPGLDPARVTAFLTAMRECLSLWLDRIDPDVLMPHDVLLTPQKYKSGKTVDDFRKLLRRKLKLD